MKQPTSKNKLVRLLTGNQFLWSAVFSIPILLFLLLAFKQPYSGRSLIGNFDPFPDSFYYVVSPLRLLSTGKYEIATRYGVAKQSVPPLYGMALLPGYVLNPDPRTYYFTNVLLGIGSIALLGLIVKKTTKSAPLSLFGMLMYTLQYAIYWQPQLAMAENLLVFLLLLTIWFWQRALSWKNLLILTILAWSLIATKYVAAPLTLGWLVLLAVRVCREESRQVASKKLLVVTLLSVALAMAVLGLRPLWFFVAQLTQQLSLVPAPATTSWFSLEYFTASFPAYGKMLLGEPTLHLWSTHQLIPPGFFIIALSWSCLAIIKRWQQQKTAWVISVLTAFQLGFLSLTEMIQARYAYVFIPLLILGVSLALWQVRLNFAATQYKKNAGMLMVLLVSAFIATHVASAAPDLKTQLLVNRHQSEVAWWREGLVQTDQYFSQHPTEKQRVVISALPPFLWEMYTSPSIIVAPLAERNYFSTEAIWGVRPSSGQTWLQLYQALAADPEWEVYVSTSGFTGSDYESFDHYKVVFSLETVYSGCNDTCIVYRILPL